MAFRDATNAHCFDQIVDYARRTAPNPDAPNDRDQSRLGGLARLKKGGKTRRPPQLPAD
jgi:hypothetical protein